MYRLIRDLLDTTRIAEGRLVLSKSPFDLNALISERAEELQRITDKHSLVLRLDPVPEVIADRERIGQVLTNLLSNAIKYSPDAGDILISCCRTAGGIRVSVEDHGIGIPADAVDKVFDRFFRVHSPITQAYPGMGLGLYITAQIVQQHGGYMDVTSQLGDGSEFSFVLPV